MDRLRRPSVMRSISDGSTRLTHVPDGELQLDPDRWFTDPSARVAGDHLDADGMLVAGIGALLVERDGRAMLVDAGVGVMARDGDPSGLTRRWRGGDLLDGLRTAGIAPSEIERVALTHLHVDHAGWLLQPRGARAFPSARISISRPEWQSRRGRVNADVSEGSLDALTDLVDVFDDGDLIWPGVRARPAPGHTAGHSVFEIAFDGGSVLALGDAMHTSVQVAHPSWRVAADEDPALACATRARLCRELAQPRTIGYGVHFADVVFGRIERAGTDAPEWTPVDDTVTTHAL